MLLKENDDVFVEKDKKLIKAKLLQYADFSLQTFWWVEFFIEGNRHVSLFEESDLLKWNKSGALKCECGGTAVGATKHPYYCPKFE